MEQARERHDGVVIAEQPISDFLTKNGLNPDDFRITNVFTFEQLEENGEYEHTGLELHVMKKEHTDKAFIVHSDFHRRALGLSNEDGKTLDTGVGLRHMDEAGYKPSFFEVVELYQTLGAELPEHL